MSRSYKHSPFLPPCCGSNSKGKKICNRKFRRRSNQNIRSGLEPLYNMNEAMDSWDMGCDGLAFYRRDIEQKYLRK